MSTARKILFSVILVCLTANTFGQNVLKEHIKVFDDTNYVLNITKINDDCILNESCARRNECIDGVRCKCDDSCIEYGDCCMQASIYNQTQMVEVIGKYDCLLDKYMIRKCPESWSDETVKAFCHQAFPESFAKDPLRDAALDNPVTSSSTNITYANYYCAICNNESNAEISGWSINVSCRLNSMLDLKKYSVVNQTYLNENFGFGDHDWYLPISGKKGLKFQECSFMPVTSNASLRYCKKNIQKCAPTWTNKAVEIMCHSYTNFVFTKYGKTYKNYHCAKCNYVHINDMSITHVSSKKILNKSLIKPESEVTAKLNFLLTTPPIPCYDGEIWDVSLKNCRNVTCSHHNNGDCVTLDL